MQLIGLVAALFASAPVWAQGIQLGFGGEDHDASAPVEVTADLLEVDEATGAAVFTGNVLAQQADMVLSAARVDVFYLSDDEAEAEGAGGISHLVASGAVTLTNGAEAAEAERATYDVSAGTVTMEGAVILTQGPNVISGEALTIQLDSGTARMEGRVRTVFQPQSDEDSQ
ncbi:LptA/OstA family protein [Oceanomicrobium pacificus]|nr:LptA/OstA family protein [Oceanomicrobium pacificus]